MGHEFPTIDFIGESFQEFMETIWGWLMDNEVSAIGVWGMGGVGKTTVLKHMYYKLLQRDSGFDHVIWLTISQNYSILQLQKAIAESFGLHLSANDEEMEMGVKLLHAFKRTKKCVIILDDVWNIIPVVNIGIPLIDNGIKLIVASRLRDVCKGMCSEENILNVRPVSEAESWGMFLKNFSDYETLPAKVKMLAQHISDLCEGLPLAIVTKARSMRGKVDEGEWDDLFGKLFYVEEQEDMKNCVFPILRLIYDHLNDRVLQECFLHIALNFKSYVDLKRDDLVKACIDEGLISGKESYGEQYAQGHLILQKLTDNCLLEDLDEFVELNISFRLMAASIANKPWKFCTSDHYSDEEEEGEEKYYSLSD